MSEFINYRGEHLTRSEAGFYAVNEAIARRFNQDATLRIFGDENPPREPSAQRVGIAPTDPPSVMCDGKSFFIRERGRFSSVKTTREIVQRRFGAAFLEAVLSMPFSYIVFEDDPRAEK